MVHLTLPHDGTTMHYYPCSYERHQHPVQLKLCDMPKCAPEWAMLYVNVPMQSFVSPPSLATCLHSHQSLKDPFHTPMLTCPPNAHVPTQYSRAHPTHRILRYKNLSPQATRLRHKLAAGPARHLAKTNKTPLLLGEEATYGLPQPHSDTIMLITFKPSKCQVSPYQCPKHRLPSPSLVIQRQFFPVSSLPDSCINLLVYPIDLLLVLLQQLRALEFERGGQKIVLGGPGLVLQMH